MSQGFLSLLIWKLVYIPHSQRKTIKNSHHGKGWKKAKGWSTTEKYTGVVGGCFMMFHCYVG